MPERPRDGRILSFATRKAVTIVARYDVAMKGMGTLGLAQRGLLTLAAGAVFLGGCGSPTTAGTTQSSSHAATSAGAPTPNATTVALITAYAKATAAFVHAEKTMDPNDPALLATMTGQELSTVKKNLIIDRAGGLVARGDITPSDPHVASVDGQTAVVRDCAYSALLLYDKTGQPAPGNASGPQNVGVTATLSYVDGAWKESLVDGRFGSCPLGY
jgi:hypothetical protein